jgi:hypothetical protein
MKSSRNRGKRELVHPIFLECKEQVENGFWKTLFEELAYGKYPKQFYITSQQVIQSSVRDAFQYSFYNKPVETIIRDVQELLTLHTNLISNEDMDLKKLDNEKYKKEVWNNWKDVKKKYIRDILIMEYCIFIKQQLDLSLSSLQKVYHTINNLLQNGQLNDVTLKNNKIESIKGINILTEQQSLSISFEPIISKEECVIECPDLISNYCKRYLLKYVQIKNGITQS